MIRSFVRLAARLLPAVSLLLLVLEQSAVAASLSVGQAKYDVGARITVTYETPIDEDVALPWIGLFDATSDHRLNYWNISERGAGSLDITAPIDIGRYELRLVLEEGLVLSAADFETVVRSLRPAASPRGVMAKALLSVSPASGGSAVGVCAPAPPDASGASGASNARTTGTASPRITAVSFVDDICMVSLLLVRIRRYFCVCTGSLHGFT